MNRKYGLLAAILFAAGITACMKNGYDEKSFSPELAGKWVLTDTQSAGTGPPGVWAKASPADRWVEVGDNGNISGTVFPAATGYQLIDSVTLKVIDPSQAAGFRLFNYKIDTVQKALFFYKRPPNGGYCIEGCGSYKFMR